MKNRSRPVDAKGGESHLISDTIMNSADKYKKLATKFFERVAKVAEIPTSEARAFVEILSGGIIEGRETGEEIWVWLLNHGYSELRSLGDSKKSELKKFFDDEYRRATAKRARGRSTETQPVEASRDYPPEIRQCAEALVRDAGFFFKLGKALETGFILPDIGKPRYILGEEDLKRHLAVNIAMARLGRHSLNFVYGGFAAGKDTLVKMLLLLTGARYVRRGYLTAAGFRYSRGIKEADMLYLPEADLRGEKGRQMRFMRADDGGFEVEYAYKDPETQTQVTEVEQIGRVSILITTNSETFDGALASGGWLFQTDDSAALTAKVVPEKLNDFVQPRETLSADELAEWQCAFSILTDPAEVLPFISIPFAPELIALLNTRRSEARRSPEKLCELIQNIAILRRYQKPEEKRGEADLADLFIALRIGHAAILETLEELTSKESAVYDATRDVEIQIKLKTNEDVQGGVTAKDLAEVLPYANDSCYRIAEQLVTKGYLNKAKVGRQNAYYIKEGADDSVENGELGGSRMRSLKEPKDILEECMRLVSGKSYLANSDEGTEEMEKNLKIVDPITGDVLYPRGFSELTELKNGKLETAEGVKLKKGQGYGGIRLPPRLENVESKNSGDEQITGEFVCQGCKEAFTNPISYNAHVATCEKFQNMQTKEAALKMQEGEVVGIDA